LLLLMLLLQVHGSPEAAEAAKQLPTWRQLPTILAAALQSHALLYLSGLGFLWMFCMSSLFSWLPLPVANIQTGTALSHSSMGHATVLATRNSTSSASTAYGSAAVQVASVAAAEAAAAASRQITQALLASTVPYIGAAAATVLVAWLASGNKLNRRAGSSSSSSSSKVGAPQQQQQQHTKMFHVAVPLLAGAVPLLCFTPACNAHPGAGFAMLCVALTAGFAANSTMIAEASRTVPPSTAGIGLTVFNLSVAMGGLAGPAVIGVLVQATGGFHWAVVLVGLVMAVAAAVAGARGVWELHGWGGIGAAAAAAAAAAAPSIEADFDVEAPRNSGKDAGVVRVAVKF
jgi:hypothetical protein